MNWYLVAFKKYAVFSGRAHRAEYWMFFLLNFIFLLVLHMIEGISKGPGVFSVLYSLGVLVPSIAVEVRRLHDTGRSGWWLLINLVPVIGSLVLLVCMQLSG